MQVQQTDNETDAGRQQEFMALYRPLHASLSRFCEALTRNNHDARDLMSDTVLVAFENFEKIRSKEAFLSFLFGTASRIFKSKNRRKKFWGVFEQSKAEQVRSSSDSEMSTELSMLYQKMEKLPAEQKEALALFEISGLSIKEICEVQSATESAVKSRISRARQKLTEMMSEKRTVSSFANNAKLALTNFIFFF